MALPEVHIETDGTPMHTKVILKTEDGLEWDISEFTTKIDKPEGLRTAWITIVANTDLDSGPGMVVVASEKTEA